MQRTKYFNQTRPADTQLNWTETSRASGIRRRLLAMSQPGIIAGFRVTVNGADNTKIDIATGEGYAGGWYRINRFISGADAGERISTTTDTPSGSIDTGSILNVALADYTLNVRNYISLVYAEAESDALGERTYPFTTHETVVTETYTVSILTEADWNALDADALSSRILICIVTANGAGVALTTASIEQFTQPKTHPSTTQPGSILGAVITFISDTTPLGTGTLRWDAGILRLYWTAPGDVEGAGVQITSSGAYDLYSNNTAYYITVSANYAQLQATVSQSESITVSSVYGRTIPMACAVDTIHRDMVGSGQPTLKNAHGLTFDDIPGGTLEHADYFHLNAISKDSDDDNWEGAINGTRIDITNAGGQNNVALIDGDTFHTLLNVAAGTDGQVEFNIFPALVTGRYMVYVDGASEQHVVKLDTGALWSANIRIVDMSNKTSGNGTLTWDGLNYEMTWQAPGDAVGATVGLSSNEFLGVVPPAVEGYYKLYSSDTDNWIIVYVNGNLGAGAASIIETNMNSTDTARESILPLCTVSWDTGTFTLDIPTLDDIRSWISADDREELLEEHDQYGRHTKVIQSGVRINVDGDVGLQVAADNSAIVGGAGAVGVYGTAANTAIYGSVVLDYGIYGKAGRNYGVYGSAGVNYGVFGTAPNIAIYGLVPGATGVYGKADVTGVLGSALDEYGVVGKAVNNVGVSGSAGVQYGGVFNAPTKALYAVAVNNTGAYVVAANTGVFGLVGGNYGVYGSAGVDYGVYGLADNDYGVYGKAAVNTGVYGSAVGNYGVYGRALNVGVYGTALVNNGVYGKADVDNGVYGSAGNDYGGYFSAVRSYGAWAKASQYGVYGEATAGIGVWGSGLVVGGSFTCALGSAVVGKLSGNNLLPNVAGYFSAANAIGVQYAVQLAAGHLRYDIAWCDTGAYKTAVPIVLSDGNTYALQVYEFA